MSFEKKLTVLGQKITVRAPSNTQYKKYDVYSSDDKKLFSFGDTRYQQFKDKLGYYSSKDHNDEKRRDSYRKRHAGDNLNSLSPGYMSYYYLW